MLGDRSVTALIPARGGSKGLPRKNVRPFAGRPLIAWSIAVAHQVSAIDHVVVSTDDDEIAEAGLAAGAEVPFRRPSELASDTAPGMAPVLHALDALGGIDILVVLQPTSPLRLPGDIEGCLARIADGVSSCVTVCEAKPGPELLYDVDDVGRLRPSNGRGGFVEARRQDLRPTVSLNGAVYAAPADVLRRNRTYLVDGVVGYPMPRERSVDIDTELDFEYAEWLLLRRTRTP